MTDAQSQLAELWHRGCDLLGSRYAILGGAMTWLSERNLVSALSNAGGFGVIACGWLTPARLDEVICATLEDSAKPLCWLVITKHVS